MSTDDTTSAQSQTGLPLFIHHLDNSAQSLEKLSTAQPDNTSVADWKREIAEIKADFEASLSSTTATDFKALVDAAVSRQNRLRYLGEAIQSDLRDRLAPEHVDDQSQWTKDQLQHYDALSHFMNAYEAHGSIRLEASMQTWAQLASDNNATDETRPPHDQQAGQDDLQSHQQGGEED